MRCISLSVSRLPHATDPLSREQEASLADITYLFESGALIDFSVEEVATLIRALFSDTSLRASTIDKVLKGHPAT